MFLIIALGNIVVQIPMAALAGVMIMVAIGTFDWSSLKNIHKLPRTDAAVMVVTVGTVLYTHDLSKGVFAGVVLSTIFFAIKISKVKVDSTLEGDSVKVYQLKGLLFFASVTDFHRLI
ncbi:SulP family inorganic anion transporter [Salipaludibacillus neizhouensis]